MSVAPEVSSVLARGTAWAVAARDGGPGPHLTPVVAVWSDGSIWLTTSRGTVKARAWSRDARTAGIAWGDDAVAVFRGDARTFDVLDPATWLDAITDAPTLARAGARFVARNVRAFAGYVVDARRVPLSWTPPGRVVVAIDPGAAFVVAPAGGVLPRRADPVVRGSARYRRAPPVPGGPLAGVPDVVARSVAEPGDAALGFDLPSGPVVVPARRATDDREVWAAVRLDVLAAAGLGPALPSAASLCIDAVDTWRARSAVGVLVRGRASVSVPDQLSAGAVSARGRLEEAGADPDRSALIRIAPQRVVWWAGWDSGTVRR
jgi:hypothetical protein